MLVHNPPLHTAPDYRRKLPVRQRNSRRRQEARQREKWRQKKQSGNKMAKLGIRKLLNLQRVIGGPWRIRTSNQRIMSPVLILRNDEQPVAGTGDNRNTTGFPECRNEQQKEAIGEIFGRDLGT